MENVIRPKTYNMLIQPIVLTKILRDGNAAYEALIINGNIIEDYFDPDYKEIFVYIRDFYDRHNQVPLISEIEARFSWFEPLQYEYDIDNSYDVLLESLNKNFWQRQMAMFHNQIGKSVTSEDVSKEDAIRYADIIYKYADITSSNHYDQTEDIINLVKDTLIYTRENRDKKFYPTGVNGLEDLHGWDKDSDYVVVAGRPGHGKSMLLCKFASELLKQGKSVVYYTGEMSKQQVAHRFISAITGMSSVALLKAYDDIDEQLYQFLDNEFCTYKLCIVDTSDFGHKYPTARDLEAVCNKVNADALFIDQQSLMQDTDRAKVFWEKAANISRQVKALRDKLNIPVLTAVQLNRLQTEESDTAQVAGSDVIVQDATKVLFIKRSKETDEVGISVVKNRSGRAGAKVKYQADFDKCSFRPADEVVNDEIKGEVNLF